MASPMTPWQKYQADLARDDFTYDPAQEQVVKRLQRLYDELLAGEPRDSGRWSRLKRWLSAESDSKAPTGLYIWGSVGRGKTYLMDCLFDTVPIKNKLRLHFHRFMDRVHGELRGLKDQSDPLDAVAATFSQQARLLCFDEFFVSDIGDAMILSGVLEGLFKRGTVLVATSNVVPDRLYWDGLQRAKFLPAIELIQRFTDVIELDGACDYRLRILEQAELYHFPLDENAEQQLHQYFTQIAPGAMASGRRLTVNHRTLSTVAVADGVVWFTFAELCTTARSAADYVELARRFNTLLLQDVPVMDDSDNNSARRFISLVDELYDRNVSFIMTAEKPLDDLYAGKKLAFEFERTRSRLTEMQSHEYLAREHLP